MNLEAWIRKRNMLTNDFVKLVGCSRPVIWKVKRGEAICPKYAKRILEITNNQVEVKIEKVGRKRHEY